MQEQIVMIPVSLDSFLRSMENMVRSVVQEEVSKINEVELGDVLLNTEEVAKLLNIKEGTVRGKCMRREIPFSKNGNRNVFNKQEIVAWNKAGRPRPQSERFASFMDKGKLKLD